jgi:hypothetical protein
MPRSHGKQKRQEKHKKRRELARRRDQDRATTMALPRNEARLIHRASSFPHGPSFISPEWREPSQDSPGLVSILVTRRAPGGVVVPGFALVDRTCLGVKNGFVGRPVNPLELMDVVDEIAEAHGDMEQCDLLVAQSVLYHAIDFARSLGFAPHRDFPEPLFGPRPEALLDTPLARPSRPFYMPGPHDNVARIIGQLDRAVGDAFTFYLPNLRDLLESDDPSLDEEAEYEDDEDEDDEFGHQEDDTAPQGR